MMTPALVAVLRVSRSAAAEELLPRAEVHGKVEQAVLVDEVVVDERLGELAAAVDLQLVPGPFLQLGYPGSQVAAEQRGAVRHHALRLPP
jgi:hypothetical protein